MADGKVFLNFPTLAKAKLFGFFTLYLVKFSEFFLFVEVLALSVF